MEQAPCSATWRSTSARVCASCSRGKATSPGRSTRSMLGTRGPSTRTMMMRSMLTPVLRPCSRCRISSIFSLTSTAPHSSGRVCGPSSEVLVATLKTSSDGACATSAFRSLTWIGTRVQIPSARGNRDIIARRSRIELLPVPSWPITTTCGGCHPLRVCDKMSRRGSSCANTSRRLRIDLVCGMRSADWCQSRNILDLNSRFSTRDSLTTLRVIGEVGCLFRARQA